MIGRIAGTLVEKNPPQITVDVGGVGYELEVPMSTFYNLPALGEPVALVTHLVVREDAHCLYGFGADDERTVFRQLIRISGIGARTALALLSGLSVNELAQAVTLQESGRLVKIPGIGKKTAEQILLSLGDKVAAVATELAGGAEPAPKTSPDATPAAIDEEAKQVLVDLGWRAKEVEAALAKVAAAGVANASLDELVRRALAQLMER